MYEFTTAIVGLVVLMFFVQEAETIARVVLTADPQTSNVMSGETVRLTCKVEDSDPSTQWEYSWKKLRETKESTHSSYTGEGFSTYTLSRVTESDSAQYWCAAKTENRSVISFPHILTVTPLPPVVQTLQTGWTNIFNTERAALHCDIQDRSPVWMHKWYRDGQELPVGTAEDAYEILSAVQSDAGTYTCQGQHKERVLYTGISNMVALKVNGEAPKPLLTLDPHSGEIFTGDTVTLSCRVGTDPAGWEYLWYKETQGAALTSTDSSSTDGSIYTIHSAAVSHGGEYWCRAGRGRPAFYTPYSDSLQLSITAPPPAVLTLNPAWRKFYPTEKVTVKCEIQSHQTGWSYLWYRDGAPINSALSRGNEYTIPALDQSHRGRYSCRGEIPGRDDYTEMSKDVNLTVDGEAPKPLLTLDPPSGEIFTGDTVTLSCRAGTDPAGWEYLWFKDTQRAALNSTDSSSTDRSNYTIHSAAVSHGGEYWCRAGRGSPPVYTPYSDSLQLSITAPPPAVLSLNPAWRKFYPTEKVTLKCEIQTRQTGWSYLWYRDGAAINSMLSSSGNEHTIPALDQSHSGIYSCKGRIPGRDDYTEKSNDVTLTVDALPPVVLTLQSGWTDIFNTERATLHCDIQDHSAVWMHKWYRDGRELPVGTTKGTYEILSAVQSDSGTYTCKGQHNERVLYTGSSNMVALKVNGEAPKPLLTRDPPSGEIFTGDTVTLSCRAGTDPAGWKYLWFKGTQGAALNSTDSSSTDRSNYTIHSAAVSHGGEYWCIAGREGFPVYTLYSDSLQLSITAPPPAVLTLNPAWKKFYPTEKVTLKCEIQSRRTRWSYMWYRDGASINSVPSRGNEYTILALDQSHSGRYSCIGRLPRRDVYTEMSKDVTLTVDARPQAVLTLETVWTEIFRSDSLTLRCQVEGSSAEWNYTWYRDGRHLPLDPSGDRLTLTAGNDSFSSEYKCRGNRTGQPSYTEISEGFRENNIVLKRKVLLSVASSVLLGLILTALGCVCLRKKRKLAYKMTPQNDMFLSKPPTEYLCGDLEHFSNEEQSTEAKAACSIELYSILDLKKNTEVLPPKQNPEDLTSFKAGQ